MHTQDVLLLSFASAAASPPAPLALFKLQTLQCCNSNQWGLCHVGSPPVSHSPAKHATISQLCETLDVLPIAGDQQILPKRQLQNMLPITDDQQTLQHVYMVRRPKGALSSDLWRRVLMLEEFHVPHITGAAGTPQTSQSTASTLPGKMVVLMALGTIYCLNGFPRTPEAKRYSRLSFAACMH